MLEKNGIVHTDVKFRAYIYIYVSMYVCSLRWQAETRVLQPFLLHLYSRQRARIC